MLGTAITRGTTDIDNAIHFIWKAPSGRTFDLLLEGEVVGGQLVLKDAHIMNRAGEWGAAAGELGKPGLSQLKIDLGAAFGVNSVAITQRIKRHGVFTSGKEEGFGPGVYPID